MELIGNYIRKVIILGKKGYDLYRASEVNRGARHRLDLGHAERPECLNAKKFN